MSRKHKYGIEISTSRETRNVHQQPDPHDELTPAERCQAAALILARGICRLRASSAPPTTAGPEESPSEKPADHLTASRRESPCL